MHRKLGLSTNMMGDFVSVDGVPGHYVTWESKHIVFTRKDGVTCKVEKWRVTCTH